VILSLVDYFKRLRIQVGTVTYVACVGLDHRLGWVAFGGMISTVITLVLHLLNRKWTYRPPPLASLDLHQELEILFEISAAALFQELLIMITGRITPAILLTRLLGQHAHFVYIAVGLLGLLLTNYRRPIALAFSNPMSRLRKLTFHLGVGMVVLYCACVAFLQVFVDVEEIADISLGWVYPWSYRWECLIHLGGRCEHAAP